LSVLRIIPPQLSLYMALAPEAKLTYPLAGPAGQAAFNAGMQGFEAQQFRGLGVFTSTPYEVSDDQDSVQMLQRSTQVGEFYRLSPPAVFDTTKPLPPSYMDIMIYDEESDRHVHITFTEALNATCYGHPDGPTGDLFGLANVSDELNPKLEANGGANAATWRGLGGADLTQLANIKAITDAIKAAVAAGRWVPVELVLARPFIEHLTLSAIVTVSGRDTGATLFGPADMQISANTSVKTIEGHVSSPSLRTLRITPRLPLSADISHHCFLLRSTLATPSRSSLSRRTCTSCATSCAPATLRAATLASSARALRATPLARRTPRTSRPAWRRASRSRTTTTVSTAR
jgi:hypothetical protein